LPFKKGKGENMQPISIHSTCKQRWFSPIVMLAASFLFMSATLMGLFNPATAHGAGADQTETGLTKGIDFLINVPKSQVTNAKMNLIVFFTPPVSCDGCDGKQTLAYAPGNSAASMRSYNVPVSTTAGGSWQTKNGAEEVYLDCNWMSSNNCKDQSNTTFTSLASPIPGLGSAYMIQPLDFTKQGPNGDTYGISGCMYIGDWNQFPAQNVKFISSGPNNLQLITGETLPTGITLQTIKDTLTSSQATVAGSRDSGESASEGWNG
jgi:hypothetical protein